MGYYEPHWDMHKAANRIFYEYERNKAKECFFCKNSSPYFKEFWWIKDDPYRWYQSYCPTLKEWEKCFAIRESWKEEFTYSKKLDLGYLQAVKLYTTKLRPYFAACFNKNWENIILYWDNDNCDFMRFITLLALAHGGLNLWYLKLELKKISKKSVLNLKKLTAEISRARKHDNTKVFFNFDISNFLYDIIITNDWKVVERDYKKWYLYDSIMWRPYPNYEIVNSFYWNYLRDYFNLVDEIRQNFGGEKLRNKTDYTKEELKLRNKLIKEDCYTSILFDWWENKIYFDWILKSLLYLWIPFDSDLPSESWWMLD